MAEPRSARRIDADRHRRRRATSPRSGKSPQRQHVLMQQRGVGEVVRTAAASRSRAGLQTGVSASSASHSARTPGQDPPPKRIATSMSSRAKSTRCSLAEMRRSMSGMTILKVAHPWHQPLHREGRQGGDGQRAAGLARPQSRRRLRQPVEGVAHGGKQRLSLLRQHHRPVQPPEQRQPEMLLQGLDLMADRCLGDIQFGRGAGEVQVACGRFEGA